MVMNWMCNHRDGQTQLLNHTGKWTCETSDIHTHTHTNTHAHTHAHRQTSVVLHRVSCDSSGCFSGCFMALTSALQCCIECVEHSWVILQLLTWVPVVRRGTGLWGCLHCGGHHHLPLQLTLVVSPWNVSSFTNAPTWWISTLALWWLIWLNIHSHASTYVWGSIMKRFPGQKYLL